jgi:hypothetical protein
MKNKKNFFVFVGRICTNYVSVVCGNSTCLNGGTCLFNGNMAICQCPSLFTGTYCGSLINPCDSKIIYRIFSFFFSYKFSKVNLV